MVQRQIDIAVEVLNQAGLYTKRGYPGTPFPHISQPTAIVTVHEVNEQTLALAVEIFVDTSLGGSACESAAILAAQVLSSEKAACSIGCCGFDADTGLFSARVLARWPREAAYQVKLDGVFLSGVSGFSAVQTATLMPSLDAETGLTKLTADARLWTITVVDSFPLSKKESAERTDAFQLDLIRPGSKESYPGCMWARIQLEETPSGVIRTRVAQTRQERTITAE